MIAMSFLLDLRCFNFDLHSHKIDTYFKIHFKINQFLTICKYIFVLLIIGSTFSNHFKITSSCHNVKMKFDESSLHGDGADEHGTHYHPKKTFQAKDFIFERVLGKVRTIKIYFRCFLLIHKYS